LLSACNTNPSTIQWCEQVAYKTIVTLRMGAVGGGISEFGGDGVVGHIGRR